MGEPIHQGSNQPEDILVTIGDMAITQHWVHTPSGSYPLRGSVWTVADMTHQQESIHPVGIVLAIIGVFLICIFSLLFLLIKQRTVTGYYQVTVQGPGFHHSTLIQPQIHSLVSVQQMVNYARSLAAVA